jgi:ubiquinone/menaquinone biosynthesis C-methylase UbiE
MRVVKPGSRVICLEFSHPTSRIFGKLYDIYSFKIIPEIGNLVTGNREAYTYLPESIRKFPSQEEFKKMMEDIGLFKVRYYNLFNGIAAVHVGIKV